MPGTLQLRGLACKLMADQLTTATKCSDAPSHRLFTRCAYTVLVIPIYLSVLRVHPTAAFA